MTADEITYAVARKFRTFGQGSQPIHNNPISAALAGKPPVFAAGVDVREVVEFVLASR